MGKEWELIGKYAGICNSRHEKAVKRRTVNFLKLCLHSYRLELENTAPSRQVNQSIKNMRKQ